jgi:hypothetical protein
MTQDALTNLACALADAASEERHIALAASIRDIRHKMNERGILSSSMHVNAVFGVGVDELTMFASQLWEGLKRAHRSRGTSSTVNLTDIFDQLLSAERTRMEGVCRDATHAIRSQLGNPGLIWGTALDDAHARLLRKYRIEIEIYQTSVSQSPKNNLAESTKSALLSRKPIAILTVTAAAIGGIAAFTDSISKLSDFARKVFGAG